MMYPSSKMFSKWTYFKRIATPIGINPRNFSNKVIGSIQEDKCILNKVNINATMPKENTLLKFLPRLCSHTIFSPVNKQSIVNACIVQHTQHRSFCQHIQSNRHCSTTSNNGTKSNDNIKKNEIGSISPQMCIVFTCKVCKTRTSKLFSKHSYEKGIVIIRCPGCDNNHLIADNLGWFDHVDARNIEDLLKSKGESVKRITTDDGTTELILEDVIGKDAVQKLLKSEDPGDSSK